MKSYPARIKRLARAFNSLTDRLAACTRCGTCLAACPLFTETGREADVSRGKLALLDGLNRLAFDNPDGVNRRLRRCLLCGSCERNCPGGVRILEILFTARLLINDVAGLSAAEKLLLRRILTQPELLDRLMYWGGRLQNRLTQPVAAQQPMVRLKWGPGFLKNRHWPKIESKPLPIDSMNAAAGSVSGRPLQRVGFFVGCLIPKLYPRVAHAVVKALAHHRIETVWPRRQICCGIPALAVGDRTAFQRLIQLNLNAFAAMDVTHIVTACATCTATIKTVWPAMASALPPAAKTQIAHWAERTMDINQYLVKQADFTMGSTPGTTPCDVAYHDPCHLKNSLGITAEPRALLQANPGYRLIEPADADRCCGAGGSFHYTHSDLSRRIGRHKHKSISASGCRVVATGCPGCMLQLNEMLSEAGDRIQVKHSIEIYAEFLNANSSDT